jgi:response regulator RpfG family c-di-GMP phosphodiesterase
MNSDAGRDGAVKMNIGIDLDQAIHALADALDLVGVDEMLHGKRVGLMAQQCGRGLGLGEPELEDLFHIGLLHDCAVSSTTMHRRLINELDWEGAEFHCHRGNELLGEFPPLAHLAPIIEHHHSHWDLLRQQDLPEYYPASAGQPDLSA